MRDLRGAVERLDDALPPRPSERDEAALSRIAEDFEALAERLATARRGLRHYKGDRKQRHELRAARSNERLIPEAVALIRQVLTRPSTPLIDPPPERTARSRRHEVLGKAFIGLERAIHGDVQAPDMTGHAYPFIPLHPADFTERLQAAWRILSVLGRTGNARFLDVGSGAGSKLFIAAEFFPRVEGLELDAGYLDCAARIGSVVGEDRRVLGGDALTFEGYGSYDVIYSYAPPAMLPLQDALERRIHAQARDGTIIIAPMVKVSFLQTLPQISPGIFVRGLGGAELDALRAEAEMVGAAVPPAVLHRRGARWHKAMGRALETLAHAGFVS